MNFLKGWRTVIFNVIMAVVMIWSQFMPGTELPSAGDVTGALNSLGLAISAVWTIGGIFLRAFTDTKIGENF